MVSYPMSIKIPKVVPQPVTRSVKAGVALFLFLLIAGLGCMVFSLYSRESSHVIIGVLILWVALHIQYFAFTSPYDLEAEDEQVSA